MFAARYKFDLVLDLTPPTQVIARAWVLLQESQRYGGIAEVGCTPNTAQNTLEQQDRGDADNDGLSGSGNLPLNLDDAFNSLDHQLLADDALLDKQESKTFVQHQRGLAMWIGR